MMNYLRTIIGYLRDSHDWRFKLEKDFNFDGGLKPALDELFEKRRLEVGGGFGAGSNRSILEGVESVADLDLSVFDENDPVQHTQKVLVIMGSYFGLRGNKEHADMRYFNIEKAPFPANHPWAGQDFYAIQHLPDKTTKLTTSNTILKANHSQRIPVGDEKDMKSIGGCLTRYLFKKGPTQTRLHCRVATVNQVARYAKVGHPNSRYSAEQPIGQNKIRALFKDACKKLGFEASGHAFRRVFLTTIVNAEGVNTEEALASSRHNSIAAQRTYIMRGNESETAKFKAFGL